MPSKEYPDLRFMPPRAWGSGRDGKAVRYIVIHYTAGAERNTSAEDGAVYDQRRVDGTSTHYFVDSNSVVQCVLTKDRANAARHKGNRLGIQYELCGTVQTRAQWLDAASMATLKNAARQVARDCRKYDIPVRRLTVAQTRQAWNDFPRGPKGIVGHVDCTYAYPEDGGDHTDPGAGFPWDIFLEMVRDELNGDAVTPEEIEKVAELAADKVAARLPKAIMDYKLEDPYDTNTPKRQVAAGTWLRYSPSAGQVKAVGALVQQAIDNGDVDETALAEALAPLIEIPEGNLTEEQVTEAVKVALRQGTDTV